jgi:arylsulfatase A-like enzyme
MTTTRREFIKIAGVGAAAMTVPGMYSGCSLATLMEARSGKRKPNILLIMSDDHAEQAIQCYGNSLIETPNIDRIAQEGVRFTNSFVTNSICAPSRAVMLTGKYSHLNGLRDNRDEFDGTQVTFPKLLQNSGYRTGIVGKWHLKTDPTGFNHWDILIRQGQYYNPMFRSTAGETRVEGYATDIITDKALDFLKSPHEEPFCLLVHHKAPHRNWMPSLKHLDSLNDLEIPLPATFYDNYKGREETAGTADMHINGMYLSFDFKLHAESYAKETGSGGNANWAERAVQNWEDTYARLTPAQKEIWDRHYDRLNAEYRQLIAQGGDELVWKFEHYMRDYLRCILSVDENIGRILNHLDESGLADNTIVVYTSDQGFYLGEHGWYDKRFMYEESLSMPLVVRYPEGIPAGQVSEDIVLNLDFAPTLLDYAGVTVPAAMQGASLRGLVSGETAGDWRNSMYYHYYEYPHGWHGVKRHYGVRTERYKLIHFYHDVDLWELYDLELDPQEIENRIDDPAYADVIEELKAELVRLQERYQDTSMNQL